MLFGIITLVAALFSIYADYYVYKTRISRFKLLWIFQSLIFVVPVLVNCILGYFIDSKSHIWQLYVMWALFAFIIQFICKIFIEYAIILKDKKGKSYFSLAYILTVLFAGIYLYGTFVSRCRVVVNNLEVSSRDIPSSFDGYKIALFSDFHLGTMSLDDNLLDRVIDTTNSLNPDIVIQCGDIVHIHVNELKQNRINTLKRIKAPVYSVLGNHDLGYYLNDTLTESPKVTLDSLIKIQTSVLGWHLLQNEKTILKKNGDSIFIAGVTFPNDLKLHNFNSTCGGSNIRNAMSGIDTSDFAILLSHTPKLIDSLPEKSNAVDLMLSGHVHAMQLKLFGISPAFLFYGVSTGYNEKNGVSLYLNDGIGVVGHPFRFGAPPEVTLITLKRL